MKLIKYILLITLAFSIFSCSNTEDCRDSTDVNLGIGFYKKTLNSTSNTYTIASLSIDSIWVNGLGVDSFIYDGNKSISSIDLPLKKTELQTDYIIRFDNTTDTLSVFYSNNNQFYVSLACGCVVAHTIEEAVSTNHYIDSISIVNRDVNTTSTTHIKIFHF